MAFCSWIKIGILLKFGANPPGGHITTKPYHDVRRFGFDDFDSR